LVLFAVKEMYKTNIPRSLLCDLLDTADIAPLTYTLNTYFRKPGEHISLFHLRLKIIFELYGLKWYKLWTTCRCLYDTWWLQSKNSAISKLNEAWFLARASPTSSRCILSNVIAVKTSHFVRCVI
jgi:hypothetical protein